MPGKKFPAEERETVSSEADPLLTPAEVAVMFSVSPKTVARWSQAGHLKAVRTLGGHRRFRAEEVRALRENAEDEN